MCAAGEHPARAGDAARVNTFIIYFYDLKYIRAAALQESTLHVLVTRHPYEWLDSMRRNAFYNNFHKGQPMAKFLTLEYISLDVPDDQPRYELRAV